MSNPVSTRPALPRVVVLAVALAAVPWAGCDAPEPRTARQETPSKVYSLAALGNFGDGTLGLEGRPVTLWTRSGNESVPTVRATGPGPFRLRFALEDLTGAGIRTGYDLVRRPALPDEPWTAIFRVTATTARGETRVLFEDRLASNDGERPAHRLDVTVPPPVGGPGEIGFEISFEGSETGTSAQWIDPELAIPRPAAALHAETGSKTAWNVLLITSDTTRQDFLGPYGGPAATPALEALAADGVLLRSVHSVGYGTTPSHASLLTGSPPREHGVYNNETVLADRFETLAERLVSAGWDTAAFVSSRPVVRSLGLAQGFLRYDDIFGLDPESGLGWYARHERRAERTTDRFLQWLDGVRAPFAAWIHFFDPHQPYAPPAGPPSGEHETLTRLFTDENGAPRYVRATEPADLPLEELDQAARRRYRLEIESLDLQIARILQRLEERGLYERTLIVFLSDHGENFLNRGPNLAFKHGGLYGDVTKLAAILKLPNSVHAGTVSDLLVANSDFACLTLDVLDLPIPTAWPCRSFRRHLDDPRRERAFRPYVILEGADRQEIAVRSPRWLYRQARGSVSPAVLKRLGYGEGSQVMLFDLRTDPEERRDVAALEENAKALAQLQSLARDFLAKPASDSNATLQSEDHLEGLKALGYID